MLEKIGGKKNILELPYTIRLNTVFHVNNLRQCPTHTLRPAIPDTTLDDDDMYDLDRISVVKMDTLPGRRGKYMLFCTH
jgi:hypothetical protein